MRFLPYLIVICVLLSGCAVPASRWRNDAFSRFNSAISAGSQQFAPEETDNIRQTIALADRYAAQHLFEDADRLYRLSTQKSQLLYRNLVLSKVRQGVTLEVQSNEIQQPQVIALAPETVSMKAALEQAVSEQDAEHQPEQLSADSNDRVDTEPLKQTRQELIAPYISEVLQQPKAPDTNRSEISVEPAQPISPAKIMAVDSQKVDTAKYSDQGSVQNMSDLNASGKPETGSGEIRSENTFRQQPSKTVSDDASTDKNKTILHTTERKQAAAVSVKKQPKTTNSLQRSTPIDATIYLTFDDGPSRLTLPIAGFLNAQGVAATFFVLGSNVKGHEKIIRDTVALGHRVGNHTLSHNLKKLNSSLHQGSNEIEKTAAMIDKLGGDGKLVRIPYGAANRALTATVAAEGGQIFDWDINSLDSSRRGAKDSGLIEKTVLQQLRKSGKRHIVLLFHDGAGHEATLTAIRRLVPRLKQEGYRFGLLSRSERVARVKQEQPGVP